MLTNVAIKVTKKQNYKRRYLLTHAGGRKQHLAGRVNPLMATSKPQSNGSLYSNMVVGTLAVDGSAAIHLVQRGEDWAAPQVAQAPGWGAEFVI